MDLKGKVVAITGAYSGLGAALSEQLARKGCKLVLGGRDKDKIEDFARKYNAFPIVIDVRKEENCENFLKKAIEKFGRFDIMINAAGIWSQGTAEKVTSEQLKDMFETNVFGTVFCCKYAVIQMKKQNTGMIINIGSTAGIDYNKKDLIAYRASKHAVVGFTGSLAEELKETKIKVICFCPGGFKSDLYRKYPEWSSENYMESEFVAEYLIGKIENDNPEWLIVLRRPK